MEVEQVPQAHPPASFDKLSPPSLKKHRNLRSSPLFLFTAAKKLSISILIISLPLLYLSLLHVPPSTILEDNLFWFLMSNSIIILVAADSGIFSSPDHSRSSDHLYDEFIKHSRAARSSCASTLEITPSTDRAIDKNSADLDHEKPVMEIAEQVQVDEMPAEEEKAIIAIEKTAELAVVLKEETRSVFRHQKSLGDASRSARDDPKKLRRTATEKTDHHHQEEEAEEESEYEKLTDEELNKRVEEFIRRVNRQIRLQPKD